MIFSPLPLEGAWLVDLDPHQDDRGFFARTWCSREFEEHGLDVRVVQCSMSRTLRRGTLRGMHWQAAPHEETKLVSCTRGTIWDVIIDLRLASPTYGRHHGVELDSVHRRSLYVPKGFAHGFVTLSDETDVFYQMSEFYTPGAGRGLRWNDPAFGIEWPIEEPVLNERDGSYPDFHLERSP